MLEPLVAYAWRRSGWWAGGCWTLEGPSAPLARLEMAGSWGHRSWQLTMGASVWRFERTGFWKSSLHLRDWLGAVTATMHARHGLQVIQWSETAYTWRHKTWWSSTRILADPAGDVAELSMRGGTATLHVSSPRVASERVVLLSAFLLVAWMQALNASASAAPTAIIPEARQVE